MKSSFFCIIYLYLYNSARILYYTDIRSWECTLLSELQLIYSASSSPCVEKRLVLTIEPKDYITKTGAGGSIKLYVKGMVEETGQSFATQDVVELTKPKLKATVSYCGSELQLVIIINVLRKRA